MLNGTDNIQLSSQSRSCKHEGKTGKVLTISSRSLRTRGDNGATPALVKPRWGKVPQRARLHVFWIPTGDTLHKAYLEEWLETGDDSSCSPSEKKTSDREAGQSQRDGPEHAGRRPACRDRFRELRLSSRWWTVVRQDAAANDVCVLPGGTNTCP